MIHQNNLGNVSGRTYFKVTSPFEVLVPVAHYDTNTFVGSSQMLGTLYRRVRLETGDEVHDLFGGVYVVSHRLGIRKRAFMELSDKHPFEKTYGGRYEVWPVDKLNKVNESEVKTGDYDPGQNLPLVERPKTKHGRNIDSIEEQRA